jgi:hypothetical protein
MDVLLVFTSRWMIERSPNKTRTDNPRLRGCRDGRYEQAHGKPGSAKDRRKVSGLRRVEPVGGKFEGERKMGDESVSSMDVPGWDGEV